MCFGCSKEPFHSKKTKIQVYILPISESLQIISIKTTAFMLKLTVYNYLRDANNYQQEEKYLFFKIIHFSMQFSAIVSRFIVKTYLNSAFTNDLKRKENFSKNVHSCRLSLFN